MAGFDAIYKQTVTLFRRHERDGEGFWYPFVLRNVHLIIDGSKGFSSNGEQSRDTMRLHVRYTSEDLNVESSRVGSGRAGKAVVGIDVPTARYAAAVDGLRYMLPKEWKREGNPEKNFTFGYGDDFDFVVEGELDLPSPIADSDYGRHGFYNYMNANYDNVYAITGAHKYDLIRHFEVTGR